MFVFFLCPSALPEAGVLVPMQEHHVPTPRSVRSGAPTSAVFRVGVFVVEALVIVDLCSEGTRQALRRDEGGGGGAVAGNEARGSLGGGSGKLTPRHRLSIFLKG